MECFLFVLTCKNIQQINQEFQSSFSHVLLQTIKHITDWQIYISKKDKYMYRYSFHRADITDMRDHTNWHRLFSITKQWSHNWVKDTFKVLYFGCFCLASLAYPVWLSDFVTGYHSWLAGPIQLLSTGPNDQDFLLQFSSTFGLIETLLSSIG